MPISSLVNDYLSPQQLSPEMDGPPMHKLTSVATDYVVIVLYSHY